MGQGWHYGGLIGQKPIGFTGWTWADWTQEGTGFTLSSDNLTATKTVSAGTEGFYFEPSDIGGKRYFEVRMTQPSGYAAGVLGTWVSAPPNTPNNPGAFTGTYGLSSASNGTLNTRLNVSGQSAVGSNFVFTDPTDVVLCLAVDFDTGDVWMGGADPGGTRYWVTSGQTTATTTFDPASPTVTIPLSDLVSVMIRHSSSGGTITLRTTAVEHNAPSGFSLLGVDGTGAQLMRSSGVFGPSSMSAETGDDTGLEDAYATGDSKTVPSGTGTGAHDLRFGDSGNKLYIVTSVTGASYIEEWDLASPYVVNSNATYARELPADSTASIVNFKSDGTRVYAHTTANGHFQADLSTAWDLSTAGSFSFFQAYVEQGAGYRFSSDGSKLIKISNGTSSPQTPTFREMTMSTPWDVTTLGGNATTAAWTATKTISQSSYGGNSWQHYVVGFAASEDGKTFYDVQFNNPNGDTVRCYTLTSAFDITTLSVASPTFSVANFGQARGIDVSLNTRTGALLDYTASPNTHAAHGLVLPAANKPTQRWGRQLGRSPFAGTALRNTGIITTTEAYQLQL